MNSKNFKRLVLITVLIIQNGCAERSVTKQNHDVVNDVAIAKELHHDVVSADANEKDPYHKALMDAAFVEATDINDNLLAITRDNHDLKWNEDKTRLLVVAWKPQGDLKATSNTICKPHTILIKWCGLLPHLK
jgi:hypothetical protein